MRFLIISLTLFSAIGYTLTFAANLRRFLATNHAGISVNINVAGGSHSVD